uniref:Zinc finger CCHC domain-containing protein 7 n=1 Tax=Nothobranchius kuhntae TaxID=321403 RepID=A0A1A8J8L3_NOTKU
MYSSIQDLKMLEDDLYQEDGGDSEVSEINSELEFHLYSQLHYSSNALELEDDEEKILEDQQLLEKTKDGDRKPEYPKDSKPPSPDDHSYQQHLKKKKVMKQKKRQTDSKGQKLSSSAFEEVIVIDSSPVVISISESDSSNDDGICAMKTSTPGRQEIQIRKSSLGVPVTVISSSSDTSESESDTDSSDSEGSDDLENWMILGQGMQDGDQSISLNLEAGSDYSTEDKGGGGGGSWLVSDKDKEALIYNKDHRGQRFVVQVSNRYYTGKNVHCRNCNKTGHLSKNCPDPKKSSPCFLCGITSHQSRDCPNKHCNNCGQPGHLFESCGERAYWHKHCYRCNLKGHFLDACPEIWRQYHMTTKSGLPVQQKAREKGQSAYCYNCSMKGHFGFACKRKRMFSGVYPSSSLINRYDTAVDIKHRQRRMKLKADEMRETGCLPDPLPTFLTHEPPKKKQKISLNMKNHSPHQTQKKYRHSPNHIFFTHDDIGNVTPKTKKSVNQQQSVRNHKPWKPKRPVPTSRDALPSRKLALDEAEDFPRGGGSQQKGKHTKNKRNKRKQVSLFQLKAQNDSGSDPDRERTLGLASKNQKGKKKKNGKLHAQKTANKKSGAQYYPEDDDLFIIKQCKKRR